MVMERTGFQFPVRLLVRLLNRLAVGRRSTSPRTGWPVLLSQRSEGQMHSWGEAGFYSDRELPLRHVPRMSKRRVLSKQAAPTLAGLETPSSRNIISASWAGLGVVITASAIT